MTSGWGVNATIVGGVPTGGTDDLDVRKVWGALYTPGIISGCKITTSSSQLKYTVASGVVAIKTATGEVVMAPVAGGTVTASTVTSNRTDIVYVQQRFPSIEGDSELVLGVGTSLPSRALELGSYAISSGATNTNAAVKDKDVDYSIPYGASLGVLHQWQNTYNGQLSATLLREGQGSFSLPTDRMVNFSMSACVSAVGAVGFDNAKYVEYGWLPQLDGVNLALWTTPGLHQSWQTVNFNLTTTVLAGKHTVNLGGLRNYGPGQATLHFGTGGDGYWRTGLVFKVTDMGPVK